MSFSQALSGLNAQQEKLGAIGNNIANSQTVGFKSSNVQFADVYAESRIGLGVRTATVQQNFGQGNVESTNRNMDLAISGEGFFRFQQPNGEVGYSRNGQLTMTADGDLVNAQGAQIMGYAANADGVVQAGGDVEALTVEAGDLAASATTDMSVSLNLNAEDVGLAGDSVYAPDGRVFARDDTTNELYYIKDDPSTHEVIGLVFDSNDTNVTVEDTAGEAHNVAYVNGSFVAVNENMEVLDTAGNIASATGNPALEALQISKPANSQTIFTDSNGNAYSLDESDPPQLFNESGIVVTVPANAANTDSNTVVYDPASGVFSVTATATGTPGSHTIEELNKEFLASSAAPEVTPGNSNEYTYSTNATVYDSLGNARNLTLYFTKLEASNESTEWSEWKVDSRLSGGPAGAPSYDKTVGTMRFDESGRLIRGAEQSLSFDLGDEFENLEFDMSFAGSTQFANNSTVNDIGQNGYTSGSMVGVTIEGDGTIMRNYSNEQSLAAGQIALVSFRNPEGLKPDGDNLWTATAASGQELVGAAGTGLRGMIEPSAVETSNVDMAQELVDMIVAQRAYQANSQTISTQDELLQTIINL